MTKTLSTKRFLLGVSTLAEETTNPNAGGGTAAVAGSLWLRQGNGVSTPTQTYLNLTGDATNWSLQNLVNLNVFNVKAFGAVGDGVTDDTAAINATVTAALAGGGGIVYFPPGAFRVTKPVTGIGSVVLSDAHNLVFMGDGFASQITMIGSAGFGDWYMFRIKNGSSRIKFVNLFFNSNITDKDPAEQNHFINIAGTAGDPQGGPRDIDVVGCYVGFIFGDGVRVLGESGQVPTDVHVLYNDFNMVASRSCCEAQRFTDSVDISFNFCTGSQDQQIDFEPTAGDGPVNWSVVGNHIDHISSTSSAALTVSGAGNNPVSQSTRRLIVAFNTITNGGDIGGVKGLVNADVIGNIVTINQTFPSSASAPIAIGQRVQNVNILGNLCINQNAVQNRIGITVISNNADSGPSDHNVIADNIVTTIGTICQGISISDTNEMIVSGNMLQIDTSVATQSAGINASAATQEIDHIISAGNMIIGITQQMKAGIGYSCSGFNLHNVSAYHNYIRSSSSIAFMSRQVAELFLNWRDVQGNNGVAIAGAPIQGPATLEGVTLEGNAGPGAQIALVQSAAGPEGNVTAAVGSAVMNTSGGQGTVLWMKETGTGVTGGKNGWVQDGADELVFGVLDSGNGAAARFLPPGAGFATTLATEVKWTVTRPGTIRNLKVACVAGTGAATVTYSLRKNGAAACNVNIANTATSATSANTATVVAGDLLSMQVTRTVGVTAGQTAVVLSYEITS